MYLIETVIDAPGEFIDHILKFSEKENYIINNLGSKT
jgi:hypothetical protein